MEINEVYFLFLIVYTCFKVVIGGSDCPQIKFSPEPELIDNQLVHIFRDSTPYEVKCLADGVPSNGSIKWYHVQGVFHEHIINEMEKRVNIKTKNKITDRRNKIKLTTKLNNTSLYCVYQYSDGKLQIVSPEIKLYISDDKYDPNKVPKDSKNVIIKMGFNNGNMFVKCTTNRKQVIELYQVTGNVKQFLGGTDETQLEYSYNKTLTNCDKSSKIYCTALDNMDEEDFIISEKYDVIYNDESNENSEVACEPITGCKSITLITPSDRNHEFIIVVVISAAAACLIVIILIILFCVRKKRSPIMAQAPSKPEVLYAEIEILQKCDIHLPPPREETVYAQIIGVLKPSSKNSNTWNIKKYTDVFLSKF